MRFRQLEIGRGILPSDSATFWAPAQLGQHEALLSHAEEFSAAGALQIGLFQEVVPAGSHIQRARELARPIARVSPGGHRSGSQRGGRTDLACRATVLISP